MGTIANPVTAQTCFFNTLGADTLGFLFRAATGKVDQYTKNQLIACEQASLVQAGACPASALQQATNDVTSTLKTTAGGSSCPCDACLAQTIQNWINQIFGSLETTLIFLVIAAIAVYVIMNAIKK